MRKIREVLRLHCDLHFGQRQIARATLLSQSTIHEYLARFAATGLSWPLPAGLTEAELEERLFPSPAADSDSAELSLTRPLPDFAKLRHELQTHRDTTLQLLWEEYRAGHPDGFSYSRFCHHYRHWLGTQELVMRQDHRAGEKLFVDWAGATLAIYDPHTGAVHPAALFVAVLGASSYIYAEATASQGLDDWIGAHVRTFTFLGGVPELVIPDNTKTGVAKPCRYEPDLNPTYQELAMHYGIGVVPARVRKPRDKAKVEVGVQIAQRWIVAALRHRKFFSLAEANRAMAELLAVLNQRPFRKRPGSRASLFAELDQPALRPLPAEPFTRAAWEKVRVNIDYHVQVGQSFYSVPHRLARQAVEVRTTATTVEIFYRGERVASHLRAHQPHTAVTLPEHRPKAHQEHLSWPPSRLVHWAGTVGPHTAQLVERLLADKPHPEMGYRACLGLLRLSHTYSPVRMEKAAERALLTGACSYKSVKSILLRGLDTQPVVTEQNLSVPPCGHENIRGSEYFQ